LAEEQNWLDEDIELERNHSHGTDLAFPLTQINYLHFQYSFGTKIFVDLFQSHLTMNQDLLAI